MPPLPCSRAHQPAATMQRALSAVSIRAGAISRLNPLLLAHTAALTLMTIFMLWVFTHYRLVPYTQLQQQRGHGCSSGTTSLSGAYTGSSGSSSDGSSSDSSSGRWSSSEYVSSDGAPSWQDAARPTGSWAHHLLARLEAEKQQAQDPAYQAKLRAAAATPINIALMSSIFWTINADSTRGCAVDGVPLDCRFHEAHNTSVRHLLDTADALHYHIPTWLGKPRRKAFPSQLRLAMSLESAAYYEEMDMPSWMCHYDAEMSYRHCAQVINWYSVEALDRLFKDPDVPPVPFDKKLHAIAYINSNCGAESGRSDLMHALMQLGDKAKVPVHSYGNCDRNMDWPEHNPSKFQIFSEYKFCVTMENSLRQDYVTEKLWDGLRAGCIPVYLGSFSAFDVVPDRNSFIMFDPTGHGNASTPEELDSLMHQLGSDKKRYEGMLAWKQKKPQDQPNPLFRHLYDVRNTTGECALCQFLARHRVDPQPDYKTCLFDQEWMATANQHYVPKEQACPVRRVSGQRKRFRRPPGFP